MRPPGSDRATARNIDHHIDEHRRHGVLGKNTVKPVARATMFSRQVIVPAQRKDRTMAAATATSGPNRLSTPMPPSRELALSWQLATVGTTMARCSADWARVSAEDHATIGTGPVFFACRQAHVREARRIDRYLRKSRLGLTWTRRNPISAGNSDQLVGGPGAGISSSACRSVLERFRARLERGDET